MRTVTFRSVFEAVLRRMGIDPYGEAMRYDTGRAIVEHIQNAVDYAWSLQEWPELVITEERAFREIWRSGGQYRRSNLKGVPDEVYYIPDGLYYAVDPDAAGDPTPGTLPTDTDYFIASTSLDPYIPFDQAGRQSMGQVYGVYGSNPRASCASRYGFRPGPHGLQLQTNLSGTVWVKYKIRPSIFTLIPYADGHAYRFRDPIYDPITGECYVAVSDNTGLPPSSPVYWRVQPFPEFLKPYVVAQAAAMALLEWDDAEMNPERIGARMRISTVMAAEAEKYLERQYSLLVEQGYRAYYSLASNRGRSIPLGTSAFYWLTPEWIDAGVVSTLTDTFGDQWGQDLDDVDNDMQTQGLLLPLVNGQAYLDFTFTTPKVDSDGNPTTEWELENAVIENTDDADPLLLFFNIADRTAAGGRINLSAEPDSDNYLFRARVRVPIPV